MDGLPALRRGLATARADGVAPIEKMVGPLAPRTPGSSPSPSSLRGIGSLNGHVRASAALAVAVLAFLLGALVGPRLWLVVPAVLEQGLKSR